MVKITLVLFFVLTCMPRSYADTVNVAVTASFRPVLEKITPLFEQSTGHRLRLSSASTGILFQQIQHGAPFDVFLAADDIRPGQLQRMLKLPAQQVFEYATGKLVLVSQDDTITTLADLSHSSHRLVIANPAVAPFGVAAEQVLAHIGYQGEKVLANNVAQAQQYLNLGLSPVGLVAASVAIDLPSFPIDESYYTPVTQQGIVINASPAAKLLVDFLGSDEVADVYQQFGYSMAI